MRQVDDAHDPEDQRKAAAHQEQQRAVGNSAERLDDPELRIHFPPGPSLIEGCPRAYLSRVGIEPPKWRQPRSVWPHAGLRGMKVSSPRSWNARIARLPARSRGSADRMPRATKNQRLRRLTFAIFSRTAQTAAVSCAPSPLFCAFT